MSPLHFLLKKKLYDLHDDEYILWLQVNHPEALPEESSITEFFPDTPMLTPLDSGTSDNIASLISIKCLPSNDSTGSTLSSSSSFDNSGEAPETLSGDDNSLQNKKLCTPGINSRNNSYPVIVSHTFACEKPDVSAGSDSPVTPSRSNSNSSQALALKRSPLPSITNLLPGHPPKSSRTIVSKDL